jgi:hypothetical protein
MPCNLEKRFNQTIRGGAKVVIDYAWREGTTRTMTKYEVKDVRAFKKFLANNGASDCPVLSQLPPPDTPTIKVDDNYMDSETKNLIGELEIKILRLQGELRVKENLIELYRKQHDIKVDSDLMKVCEIRI